MRLTPVHTGNTKRIVLGDSAKPAHPRAYGEYPDLFCRERVDFGSSPCIRGIHLATRHDTQPKTKKYSVSTRIHI